MSTTRSWAERLVIVGISLWMVLPEAAAGIDPYRDFYTAKQKQTSREAFERATEYLKSVRPGMNEAEFLEAMHMEVLARGKKPFDARLDGYLAEASRRANGTAEPGHHYLVFGFVESGREVVKVAVDLKDRRVFAVVTVGREDEPAVAAALGPVGSTGPEAEGASR